MPYNLDDEEELNRIFEEIQASQKPKDIMYGGGSRKTMPTTKAAPINTMAEVFTEGAGNKTWSQLRDQAQSKIDEARMQDFIEALNKKRSVDLENSLTSGARANYPNLLSEIPDVGPMRFEQSSLPDLTSPQQRGIAGDVSSDLLPKEYQRGATKNYPGLTAATHNATGILPPRVVETKVDMIPEYPGKQGRQLAPSAVSGNVGGGLPAIPKFEVPPFEYPEYKEAGHETNNGDTATMRLLAYLNMAGNEFIRGASASRFKPSNEVAKSILEDASQKDKSVQDKKNRILEYLAKKQSARNDWIGLKNKAAEAEYNAKLKRYVAQNKYGNKGEQDNAFLKSAERAAGPKFTAWLTNGLERGQARKLDQLKDAVQSYIVASTKDNPSMKDLWIRNWGESGKDWFKLKHKELAEPTARLHAMFVDQLNETFRGAISDSEREAFFNMLIDYSLDPQANIKVLQDRMAAMKNKIKTEGRANREFAKIWAPRLDLNRFEDTSDALELLE